MIRTLLAWKGHRLQGGTLQFLLPGGETVNVGRDNPKAVIRVRDPSVLARIARNPELVPGQLARDPLRVPVTRDYLYPSGRPAQRHSDRRVAEREPA